MFARSYFAGAYWAPSYWGQGEPPPPDTVVLVGVNSTYALSANDGSITQSQTLGAGSSAINCTSPEGTLAQVQALLAQHGSMGWTASVASIVQTQVLVGVHCTYGYTSPYGVIPDEGVVVLFATDTTYSHAANTGVVSQSQPLVAVASEIGLNSPAGTAQKVLALVGVNVDFYYETPTGVLRDRKDLFPGKRTVEVGVSHWYVEVAPGNRIVEVK